MNDDNPAEFKMPDGIWKGCRLRYLDPVSLMFIADTHPRTVVRRMANLELRRRGPEPWGGKVRSGTHYSKTYRHPRRGNDGTVD